jgi:hypothetical protein
VSIGLAFVHTDVNMWVLHEVEFCQLQSPTRYRTRRFFNNFTTNENIAKKFEADLPHRVRNVKEKNVLLFKFRCNILIGVRIVKKMPGSVASGTICSSITFRRKERLWFWKVYDCRVQLLG